MFRMRPVLVAIAFALSASAVHAAVLPNGVVYSANEGDGSISEINLTTGNVRTAQIAVVPHNVQISPDGKTLLAVGTAATTTGGHGTPGGEGKTSGHAKTDSHTEGGAALLILNASQLAQVDRKSVEAGRVCQEV